MDSFGNKRAIHPYVIELIKAYESSETLYTKLEGPEGALKKKQMLYLSFLLTIFKNREISVNLEELADQLSIPLVIIQGIVTKFYEHAESKGDCKRYIRSKGLE